MPNQFCDCEKDGYCSRYAREMRGRMREICAGVNCDLGTAAAFRDQWKRENNMPSFLKLGQDGKPVQNQPTPLLLKTNQAPGDAVVMTAAIYSLHRAHPGKYLTAVESPYPEVFTHNPNVVNNLRTGGVDEAFDFAQALPLEMHYSAIHDSNERGIHFMQGYCEFLGHALGINVPLLTNRPRLYFNHGKRLKGEWPWEDYWLICSGGKNDFTNKLWGQHNYQQVVDSLKGRVRFMQVGGVPTILHPKLDGVLDVVGQTSLRDLFDMVRYCRGVVCGVSLLMHVAAALEKPCIVIAGGREPVQWNAYPRQHYLHTIGMTPCISPQGESGGGCWRSRTVPLGDNLELDRDTCQIPINGLPGCMQKISPAQVVELVMRYNETYL